MLGVLGGFFVWFWFVEGEVMVLIYFHCEDHLSFFFLTGVWFTDTTSTEAMTGELKYSKPASQPHKGSADVLQKSEKLWTTEKFHFPKYFPDHILSTSPRFIFYSVHPTASQSVISLKSLFTYWSREQLVEHLSIISDKHT